MEKIAPIVSAIVIGLDLVIRVTMVVYILLRQRRQKSATLAWVLLVLALPIVGVIGYLLLGEPRLGQRRRRRHRELRDHLSIKHGPRHVTAVHGYPSLPRQHLQISRLAEFVSGIMPRRGNRVGLLGDTDLAIQAIIEEIDEANDHCHLLFYIFLDDYAGERVAAALERAAARGVACRVLVDAVGSRRFLRSQLRRRIETAGVHVAEALPANLLRMPFARVDLRNHRKIAVIDGRVGFVGSQNIAGADFAPKPKYAPWVDTMLRIEGLAVRDLQGLFVEDWTLDTGDTIDDLLDQTVQPHPDDVAVQILGTGPASRHEAILHVLQAAIHIAREELILTTPYFVPDEATIVALSAVAERGIETTLVVPARNDSPLVAAASRSNYEPLLAAGVRIVEFGGGLLHAKTMTVDRDLAVIGSANLDRRSFFLNFEAGAIVYDSDFASRLRFLQKAYMADASAVSLQQWRERGWPRILWQNGVGLMSPLL